jgi:hypothetical protein
MKYRYKIRGTKYEVEDSDISYIVFRTCFSACKPKGFFSHRFVLFASDGAI